MRSAAERKSGSLIESDGDASPSELFRVGGSKSGYAYLMSHDSLVGLYQGLVLLFVLSNNYCAGVSLLPNA